MSPRAFAHLLPAEAVLWSRWLARYAGQYEAFAYDVRVGRGRPVPAGTPENLARDWTTLTQARIDAVGFQGDVHTIFEVSPRGGRSAIGAVQTYEQLYRQQVGPQVTVRLAIVCERMHPDLRAAAEAMGITVYELPPEG